MLENGDLIFVKDLSDMGQAIQASTGHYSHVAIFLDGLIYHASGQAGVICQEPAEFFEPTHLYDLYVYPELEADLVKERASKHLGLLIIARFIQMGMAFTAPSTSLKSYRFLRAYR